jgi:hypothetical protein
VTWRCALLAPLLAACVNINFIQTNQEEPVPEEALAALRPEHDDLQSCLSRLGAPQLVWEQPRGGIALGYGWLDTFDWGFSISWSPEDWAPLSFEYDDTRSDVQGAVLLFDRERKLKVVRRGFLRDLLAETRARPADVETIEADR